MNLTDTFTGHIKSGELAWLVFNDGKVHFWRRSSVACGADVERVHAMPLGDVCEGCKSAVRNIIMAALLEDADGQA